MPTVFTREQYEKRFDTMFHNIIHWICTCGTWPDTPSSALPPCTPKVLRLGKTQNLSVDLKEFGQWSV